MEIYICTHKVLKRKIKNRQNELDILYFDYFKYNLTP